MFGVSRNHFRNVFTTLLRHSSKLEGNKEEWKGKIKEIFEALTTHPHDILLAGKTVKIQEIKGGNLKIFAQFAKAYFKKHSLTVNEALDLEPAISQVMRGLNDKKQASTKKIFEKGRSHLLLKMEVPARPPAAAPSSRMIDCQERLERLFQERKKAISITEKTIQKVNRTHGLITAALLTPPVIGLAAAIAGAILVTPYVLLVALAAAVLYFIFAFGPALAFYIHPRQEASKWRMSVVTDQWKEVNQYIRLSQEKEFKAYLEDPANKYDALKNNQEHLLFFFKKYEASKTGAAVCPPLSLVPPPALPPGLPVGSYALKQTPDGSVTWQWSPLNPYNLPHPERRIPHAPDSFFRPYEPTS